MIFKVGGSWKVVNFMLSYPSAVPAVPNLESRQV